MGNIVSQKIKISAVNKYNNNGGGKENNKIFSRSR